MSVNTYVTSQSLSHFLFYLIIILLFILYDRHEEINRLHQISVDQDEMLIQCQDAITSQRNYIILLEAEYIKHNRNNSPIH